MLCGQDGKHLPPLPFSESADGASSLHFNLEAQALSQSVQHNEYDRRQLSQRESIEELSFGLLTLD